MSANRAVLFVDGNNWYHALTEAGVTIAELSYSSIAKKLTRPREWIGLRYYIGQVNQSWNAHRYAEQRRFLSRLKAEDKRISIHLGRLEKRSQQNDLAKELLEYVETLTESLSDAVYNHLVNLGRQHSTQNFMVEKAVDVMLAVDLVTMSQRDEYDTAYLLSADGDYTPAVSFARSLGKSVFAVTAEGRYGAELARAVNSFIKLPRAWFQDCCCGKRKR